VDKPVFLGELEMPKFEEEGYDYYEDSYFGEDGKRHLRDDAPEWAKKEFEDYYAKLHPEPDEDGIIIQY